MGQLQRLVLAAGLMAATNQVSAGVAAKNDTKSSGGKNPFTQDFAKLVEEKMKLMHVPGMAVAVVDDNDVYTEGYGLAVLPDTKVTPDTLFYAGSTTKAQTAACLSVLIQNGTYEALAKNWSTPISSVLKDDFVVQDQWATEHLTFEDAVCHRTGMPREDRDLRREQNGMALSMRDIVRSIRNLPYYKEPRVKFGYNNWPFITLSHVLEIVTKKKLGQVMRELLWNPLGMKSTYFGLEARKAPGQLAAGYTWINTTQQYNQSVYMPLTDVSGAAAVISNARDYAKWLQGLLNQTQVFPESVLKDIRTPRMLANPMPTREEDVRVYGLGWFRTTYMGRVLYWHDGSMIGFKTLALWLPEEKFGVAMFGNAEEAAPLVETLSWELIANRFAVPEMDRFNHTAEYLDGLKEPEQELQDNIDDFYPDRPKKPMAPSFNISALAGTYSNKESGDMTLRVNPHDKKMLIADRPDMTWHYALRFRHVYGDKWIATQYRLEITEAPLDYVPAEFMKGDGGKPSALVFILQLAEEAKTDVKGNVTFAKIN